jgi:hypothetical protein
MKEEREGMAQYNSEIEKLLAQIDKETEWAQDGE